ncbi:MAG TPA: hypothetical protein VMU88_04250 [bacterium]|nr:hypothetical protein [bacterium]
MRRLTLVSLLGLMACPLGASAATAYKDAAVRMLDGTVMVQKADGSPATALQTGSVVEEGDAVTVYDKSWLILKTRKGDEIGFTGDTVASFDQLDKEGGDRELRIILYHGTLLLKATDSSSQQSYFEVHTGNLVTSLGDSQLIVTYDPAKSHTRLQHLRGRISVFDKDGEHHLKTEGAIWNWQDGHLVETGDPDLMDQVDVINFNHFFNGDPLIIPSPTY